MAQPEHLPAGSPLRVWWSRSPAPGNFGDVLTPWLLRHYGIAHAYENRNRADAICIGSIIRHARAGMLVLGSGAMARTDQPNPAARYAWVRGPITAELVRRAGGDCPDVYGDPAMLLPRIFPRTVEPVHEVGVFPHYVDMPECARFPVVINPLDPAPEVLRRLWACKRIVSSSLHGIIAAHAYGIPAAWVRFSDRLDGDGTKFDDHAQAVGLPSMPLSTMDAPIFTTARYDDDAINRILQSVRATVGR